MAEREAGHGARDGRGVLTVKTYGTIELRKGNWYLTPVAHVMMRAKRCFGKLGKRSHGHAMLADTPENARDLEWFLSRYPMVWKSAEQRAWLVARAKEHREAEQTFEGLLSGARDPRVFNTAIQLRDYQRAGADCALSMRSLLIADDLGLGKSAEAIAVLCDPRTRPALVVTLAHLTRQWASEIAKFNPSLRTHILRKGTPYDLRIPVHRRVNGQQLPLINDGQPDVLISTYHKLSGWADVLAGKVRSVVFDEVQELRHGEDSGKGKAAYAIAKAADFRVGLSVGPDSIIELCGGPFGAGWVGRIEDAWDLAHHLGDAPIGIEARGWCGKSFGWKLVKTFIRHECDRPTRRIKLGGLSLVATDDHSVFVASEKGLVEKRAVDLKRGDIVPVDDGQGWEDGAAEAGLDVAQFAAHLDRAQVTVDLRNVDRRDLGLSAWQWQNCHREATYGTRIPVPVYMQHRSMFPTAGLVYIGRGKAASAPAFVRLSEWAYVLGFYLGDGWVSGESRVCFAVDNPRVDDFIARLSSLPLGLRPKIRAMKGASSEVRCTHKLFAAILCCLFGGAKCHAKKIPGEWIIGWPRAARLELLRGMLDSDGSISNRTRDKVRAYYATTSPELAHGLLALLRSLGVRGGMYERPPAPGGTVNGRRIIGARPSYVVHWSPAQVAGNTIGKTGHQKRWHGAFNEGRVSSSELIESPGFVYDLEMDGHPSFVADGFLVHNSATPIYNYGGEFHNVFEAVRPGALGSWGEFSEEWCGARVSKSSRPKIKDPKAFGSYLRDQCLMIRRTRAEVGRELPSLQNVAHYIDCDADTIQQIESKATELARVILATHGDNERGAKMRASEELSNLARQATGIAKAPYVAEFVRMLLEQGEPVVLYGWHRECYAIWNSRLAAYHPVMYTGSESEVQKNKAKEAFLKQETNLLVMSLRSGAGLDGLQQRCRTVVYGELDWSPAVHDQCSGRVHRDGQKDPVVAYYLIAEDGSDPIVADVLGVKRGQIVGVTDPNKELVERLDVGADHVRKLAERYLRRSAA
jgi:hypothetical protein